jgi:hypothetical protein
VMFLIKENAQIPTATPVAANKGYTSGLNQRLAIEIAEQMIRTREIEGGRRRRRFSVLVIQLQKRPHRLSLSRLSKIAVMVKSLVYLIIRDSQAHKFSTFSSRKCLGTRHTHVVP